MKRIKLKQEGPFNFVFRSLQNKLYYKTLQTVVIINDSYITLNEDLIKTAIVPVPLIVKK